MLAVLTDRTPPISRKSWLEISRRRAFLTHLALSATIVGIACAAIFFIWYPRPYFEATGAWHVLRVLIGVDLVLGPLLTLIVFKPGKWGLKFDLCAIALVQLAALIYGLTTIYEERPYFTVFAGRAAETTPGDVLWAIRQSERPATSRPAETVEPPSQRVRSAIEGMLWHLLRDPSLGASLPAGGAGSWFVYRQRGHAEAGVPDLTCAYRLDADELVLGGVRIATDDEDEQEDEI